MIILIKGSFIFLEILWFIQIPVCGPKSADIIFALDASESLTAADFEIEKEFVYNFTKQFKIGRDNVQFGAITIADQPHPDFYLNTYHDRRHLLDKIQSLVFLQSGTNTADTLKIIHDEMFKGGHGGRHSASRIVVVLTDGMSKDTNRTREEAHNLQKVATVHAIGIGSIFLKSHLWIRRYISISSSEWKWTFKWYQWNGVPLYEGENLVNGLLKAVIKFFIGPCIFMEQIFGLTFKFWRL